STETHSATVEAMEEKLITVDGHIIPLNKPFFVMATQNLIEYEGTYPLPEAQLDRFILKLQMGYPKAEEEMDMLERTSQGHPLESISPVMNKEELIAIQEDARAVYVDENVRRYIINLVTATRTYSSIYLGVSPRGSIALMKAAKAYAYIHGRDYVLPDDVKYLAGYVLPHRILLTAEAKYDGMTSEKIIQ